MIENHGFLFVQRTRNHQHNNYAPCSVKFLILGQVETVTWAHNPEFCCSDNKMSCAIVRYLTQPSEFLGRNYIGLKFEGAKCGVSLYNHYNFISKGRLGFKMLLVLLNTEIEFSKRPNYIRLNQS